MTLPHERTRAVIKCEEFLRQLALDTGLPQDIRDRAHHLLRHYPSAAQITGIGRLEELLTNAPLNVERMRRVASQRQLIFSSSTTAT